MGHIRECLLVILAIFSIEATAMKDVEVFNENYNRNLRNANNFYRFVDIPPQERPEPSWKASTSLIGDDADSGVSGEITFKQWNINQPVLVSINVTGLPIGKHSVHIHAFGDVTEGCKSTGPHFRSSVIGNIETKAEGATEVEYESLGINLFGLSGILGRSIVIHEKPSEFQRYPDLYSPESQFITNLVSFQTEEDGVGKSLACGIVTITNNIREAN